MLIDEVLTEDESQAVLERNRMCMVPQHILDDILDVLDAADNHLLTAALALRFGNYRLVDLDTTAEERNSVETLCNRVRRLSDQLVNIGLGNAMLFTAKEQS